LPIFVCEENALEPLRAYCRERGLSRFWLVADKNTYRVLGQDVEQALLADGASLERVILEGNPVVTDEAAVMQILAPYGGDRPCVFLAVGSGTITDLVRFTSHRSGNQFISLPTAPSVDGYTSAHSPLILNGFKTTLPAQSPLAIFAHLPVLCAAPRPMIAAGFGDLLGKFTSLADWRLGALLWGEPYDEEIASQTRQALLDGTGQVQAIATAHREGVRALMEALVTTGISMLQAGGSRPASGSEHHLAHFGR
jgi:glycerol-1-phosphate dehydrogenase [NAD(P)+]